VPVVVLFGPTVPALGFLPPGAHRALERLDLNCRPCAVHGGRRCPRGDHACLAAIAPDEVVHRLDELAPAPRAELKVIHVR
jgi:heptosyltransferase-2